MSKFKVGDEVRIIGNTCSHEFDTGDVVRVSKVFRTHYTCINTSKRVWSVTDQDIEPIVKAEMDCQPEQGYPIKGGSKPDGGPAGYYDLPSDRPMKTLNDILEWKGDVQWLGDSFHLANVTKAGWRWGIKDGTTKAYDARKFIYSGARLLMKYAGVQELRDTLQKMLDDPQFKEDTNEPD